MTEPTNLKAGSPRIYVLDVVRFLAALMVVLYHYTVRGAEFTGIVQPQLAPIAKYGYLGVDLFFVISGFVVLMSSLGRKPGQFFQSRFVRVVPMFLPACLITFAYIYFTHEPALAVSVRNLVLDMSLLGITPATVFLKISHVDGVYWTLVYETTFYILIWLALSTGLIKNIRPLLLWWLAITAAGAFFQLGMISKILSVFLLTQYASYFIAGGLFYLIWRERRAGAVDILALIGCWALSILFAVRRLDVLTAQNHMPMSPWAIGFVVTAIFALFVGISAHRIPDHRFRSWAWAGALTYPLYLLHQNIGYGLMNDLKASLPPTLVLLLVFVIVLGGSWLAHKYLERPLARVFKNWFGSIERKTPRIMPVGEPPQ
ncbi:acyltransferase [Deinococcus detaillensis]|uniref:Acyltransferase n=1 Tax=Deinococcus detaillensis TaxID=2592048 RepID=A0A553UKR0_9DEIO|nr:acyltransferase [Deinococcus detaillensis]TSA80787.1 acyltransferase [Deinococcus detaillensis]